MFNQSLVFCVLLIASFSLTANPNPKDPPDKTAATSSSINLIEMNDNKEIVLQNVTNPKVIIPLTFEQKIEDEEKLIIKASEFFSTNAEVFDTDLSDDPKAEPTGNEDKNKNDSVLKRSEPKLVYLIANLPFAGSYKAVISASIEKKPEVPPLKVTMSVTRTLNP